MAATKIRVTLTTLEVHDATGALGPGEWQVNAQVKRTAGATVQLGDPSQQFEALAPNTITLNWNKEITIDSTDKKFVITVQVQDTAMTPTGDMGKVEVTLNTPIVHSYNLHLPSSQKRYTAGIDVTVLDSTPEPGGAITTIVQNNDSSTYNTVNDEMLSKMVHICPVIPVPWTTGIPPIAKGVQPLSASPQVDLSIGAAVTDLNALVNPAVIPVLDPLDADFSKQCARIRITQFRPADLDLTKIIWLAATSTIQLWDGAAKSEIIGGQEVKAYGVLPDDNDAAGTIEVRWNGPGRPLLAVFRCWVGKPKYIWTRANVIKTTKTMAGPGGTQIARPQPTVTPAQIKSQIDHNNVILWQAGVRMVFDNNTSSIYKNAVVKDTGIFEVTEAQDYTFNVPKNGNMVAPVLNARDGVFNVAYLHSCLNKPTLNGSAVDRRLSAASSTVTLSGSPSTSWIRPTGVYPDDDGGDVKMLTMGPSTARASGQATFTSDGTLSSLSACIMTQQGATALGSLTIAHELCHVIGLHHRGSGGGETQSSTDQVNHIAGPNAGTGHPWQENLLSYGPNSRRQDLDLIQAQTLRSHKLLKNTFPGAAPPPPPPPPATPKPVPPEYHPSTDDKILLQEYLGGTRAGLTHTGYDLGTSGPNNDGVDGIVGSKTKQAIKDFQRDHGGLTIDGIYGPKTRAAFDNELNGTPEP